MNLIKFQLLSAYFVNVLWPPMWLVVRESTCQCTTCKRRRFSPWVGKTPRRRKRRPAPVFLPGKFHGQRSPWGHKELEMTEQLNTKWEVYVKYFFPSWTMKVVSRQSAHCIVWTVRWINLFFFWLCSLWDLCFLTRDWSRAFSGESAES